jgi:hypothetical protein
MTPKPSNKVSQSRHVCNCLEIEHVSLIILRFVYLPVFIRNLDIHVSDGSLLTRSEQSWMCVDTVSRDWHVIVSQTKFLNRFPYFLKTYCHAWPPCLYCWWNEIHRGIVARFLVTRCSYQRSWKSLI